MVCALSKETGGTENKLSFVKWDFFNFKYIKLFDKLGQAVV